MHICTVWVDLRFWLASPPPPPPPHTHKRMMFVSGTTKNFCDSPEAEVLRETIPYWMLHISVLHRHWY